MPNNHEEGAEDSDDDSAAATRTPNSKDMLVCMCASQNCFGQRDGGNCPDCAKQPTQNAMIRNPSGKGLIYSENVYTY